MGDSEDKRVGEWFGPNTAAQVLKYANYMQNNDKCFQKVCFFSPFRKLVKYDDWCSITIHVAMDNNIVTEEISEFTLPCMQLER